MLTGDLPDTNEKGTLDKYYVVELMRRGKDNPDMPAANYHFKNYYIYSWHDLEKYEEEIKNICGLLHLRAYCSVNYKLMSQVALDTMAESARRIASHDYKKFYAIFESCSGKFVDHDNGMWVIDVDEQLARVDYNNLVNYINKMDSRYKLKVVFTMPTKSGLHLIFRPFNLKQFKDGFREYFGDSITEIPDIKKNHLTLLYENL
jgi:hypothetical protein